jgi:hypothetical protein
MTQELFQWPGSLGGGRAAIAAGDIQKPRLGSHTDGAHLQAAAEDLCSLQGTEHPLWIAQMAVFGNDGVGKGRQRDGE